MRATVASTIDLLLITDRHGARLDAADEQWQQSSPTPYDTPLTYGGWLQTRALGARIATLLAARDHKRGHLAAARRANGVELSQDSSTGSSARQRHSKSRVIIHSSPFLRCMQTSISIAAGMAQQYGEAVPLVQEPIPPKHGTLYSRPHNAPPLHSSHLHHAVESLTNGTAPGSMAGFPVSSHFERPLLRIDACFGEWNNPKYYELTSSPPESRMMLAGARAELLRKATYNLDISSPQKPGSALSQAFPGGWGSLTAMTPTSESPGPLDTITELAENLPPIGSRSRANSTNTSMTMKSMSEKSLGQTVPKDAQLESTDGFYVAPNPSYAVSPNDAIPAGYVSHARDACVRFDSRWDSMRPPSDFGDGGLPEESWAAMHKRFGVALTKLLRYYAYGDARSTSRRTVLSDHRDDMDASDTVLVIVTHSAGCNALVSEVTAQPWLSDIGVASLTMAVRKDLLRTASPSDLSRSPQRGRSEDDLLRQYEVKLVGSTEHLRVGSNPMTIPSSHSACQGSPTSPVLLARSTSGEANPRAQSQMYRSYSSSSNTYKIPRYTVNRSQTIAQGTTRTPTGLWGSLPPSELNHEVPRDEATGSSPAGPMELDHFIDDSEDGLTASPTASDKPDSTARSTISAGSPPRLWRRPDPAPSKGLWNSTSVNRTEQVSQRLQAGSMERKRRWSHHDTPG